MKTRILSCAAALALLLAILAGCASHEPEATAPPTLPPTPAATADPHEGQLLVSDGYGGTMWVNEAKNLTPFPLDTSLFSVSGGVVSYAGEDWRLMRGIDVSDHQGEIDWEAVAASGVEFAMVRCGWRGYGGGSLNEDERYRENIEGARKAGLKVGAYFFSQAVSLVEGAEEAVYTLSLLDGYELDLPVFFDWEPIGTEPARTDGVSGAVVTDACLEFIRLIESAGYESGVYSFLYLSYYTYELDRLAGVTIWMGDPGAYPEFYYDHRIWQYSATGSVPGIEGDVDMDVMFLPVTPYLMDVSQTEVPG